MLSNTVKFSERNTTILYVCIFVSPWVGFMKFRDVCPILLQMLHTKFGNFKDWPNKFLRRICLYTTKYKAHRDRSSQWLMWPKKWLLYRNTFFSIAGRYQYTIATNHQNIWNLDENVMHLTFSDHHFLFQAFLQIRCLFFQRFNLYSKTDKNISISLNFLA